MNAAQRHQGVLSSTGSRVFILWRTLEDEPDSCLYVFRDSLPDIYSTAVTNLVLGDGQRSIDLYEVLNARGILDGGNMLTVLHKGNYIQKGKTSEIMMHVGNGQSIRLDHLNSELDYNKSSTTVVDTVQKTNPYDGFKPEEKKVFGSTIVTQLVDQALQHHRKYEELKSRAIALEPNSRDSFPSSDIQTTIIEIPVPAVENEYTFNIPEGMSFTKVSELLKEHMKNMKKD